MLDHPIACKSVWKIFGRHEAAALRAARDDGMGKDEVFKRFSCVVGVADVSFSVTEGEIFCIMGLSGSGKSTLVRHLNRLIEPSAGEVKIAGEDIGKYNPAQLRDVRSRKIGMVFQNMALLPHRSVRDNVALSLELRGIDRETRFRVANEKLALVSLDGWGDRFPDELSGGMKQRVGLARAMAADPEILLMDEPFSALDPLIRRQLQDQFIALSAQMRKTTIFITHDLEEAIRIGNRIAIMKDGRVVQIGTPEEIVTNPCDDYVKRFVAGISRINLVTAHKVMQPLTSMTEMERSRMSFMQRASPGTKLDALLDIACDSDDAILVCEGEQQLGVISKRTLLRGIQGRQAH